MKITPQTNIEGPVAYVTKRLGHEPSTLFWLLVRMVEKCPAIDINAARAMFKDLFSSGEFRKALADLREIAPLWSLQPPVSGGNSYGFYDTKQGDTSDETI